MYENKKVVRIYVYKWKCSSGINGEHASKSDQLDDVLSEIVWIHKTDRMAFTAITLTSTASFIEES